MQLLKRIPWFHRLALLACGLAIGLVSVLPKADPQRIQYELPVRPFQALDTTLQAANQPATSRSSINIIDELSTDHPQTLVFEVKPGETLSHLFDRARISPTTLFRILGSATPEVERRLVRNLQPGNTFEFMLDDDNIRGFTLWSSPMSGLRAEIDDNQRITEWESFERQPTREVRWSRGTINNSLFFAGRDAGLSETMTMNLAQLFGWDIDFALDIRRGDEFAVLFEELYLDGEFIGEGNILAATFTNQGRTFNAIRYTDDTGRTSYYDEEGRSVRKAFLRTPVDIGRISSHFNPNRRHPILNTIRAHRGTDYAAPTGTPIRVTGDGRVLEARTNGGYGRMVLVQHGERIRTLYAHMNGYASGIRPGVNVRQGQVIGYVGMTGAATGPHLHYEFLVNGVHKNPVTVELPDAEPINSAYRQDFMAHANTMLQHLESTRQMLAETEMSSPITGHH